MIRSYFLILMSFCTLTSCATVYTFTEDVDRKFNEKDHCPEDCTVHRVYSGVSVDACILRTDDSGQGAAIAFWDLPFSFVLDTVVLPYTTYKQLTVGGSFSEPTGAASKCEE